MLQMARNAVPVTVRQRLREPVKGWLRLLRRKLRLSPIQRVCAELERRGVSLRGRRTLEVFGYDGNLHTKDYAPNVGSLEIWELDPRHEAALRKSFPQATVKIVDSYAEIKRTDHRFDLIVVDNFEHVYGPYCEHFDLFPDVFRVSGDDAVLIVNVIPRLDESVRIKWPYLFEDHDMAAHLARRRAFYGTATPTNIAPREMLEVYTRLARSSGFEVEWHFLRQRHFVSYLVLKLKRMQAS